MKGWRTVLLNAAVGGVALTDWLLNSGDLVGALVADKSDAALALAAITAANLLLRKLTTGPLGSKQ